MYTFGRLGKLLKELRPAVRAGNWFSLKQLNERLSKLREYEEKEATVHDRKISGFRKTMCAVTNFQNEKPKKSALQKRDALALSQMGRTPDFMLKPLKEHLVEKVGAIPGIEEERIRREARVLMYKEKRQSRLFSQKIRYQGRFVKRF